MTRNKSDLLNRRTLLLAELEQVNKMLEEFEQQEKQIPAVQTSDNLHTPCKNCKRGTYQETSIYSDWDGWVECVLCHHKIDRHTPC